MYIHYFTTPYSDILPPIWLVYIVYCTIQEANISRNMHLMYYLYFQPEVKGDFGRRHMKPVTMRKVRVIIGDINYRRLATLPNGLFMERFFFFLLLLQSYSYSYTQSLNIKKLFSQEKYPAWRKNVESSLKSFLRFF